MEYKSKSSSIALAATALIIFLILVSSAASAAPLTITETRITTSGNSTNADIYGNTIVWQDARNGGNDVYMYDSSTKKETRITKSGSAVNPAIYGNLIVWSDGRNGNMGDVYLYDLSAKKETRITKSGSSFNPDIYGNNIVWSSGLDIYMYDLTTEKETHITDGMDPAVYNNKIVFMRDSGYSPEPFNNIYMYDLSTKKETEIATFLLASNLRIYGNMILWVESHEMTEPGWSPEPEILMYDTSTGEIQSIISGASDFEIYGNRIVRSNNSNVYMYDLSTKNETKITTTGSASHPAIYGDRIVWEDSRNGKSDIYMATLSSSNPLIAAFSASPLSGKAPLKVQFADKSTGSPTSWSWNFGDKTTSTARNPIHTYSKAGKYTVSLTMKNAADSNTVTKSSYITVLGPLVAAFSAAPISGKASLTVKFTDKSTGSPTSYLWNFGDKYTSKVKNPVHKYTKAGKYTVTLKVTNAAGSNTVTKSNYITVLNPPVAAFSASPVSGKTVKFIDKSTNNPASWYWDFGDKTTSKLQSPVHKYAQAGKKYIVSLTVKNAAGTSIAKKTITTLR